VFFMIVLITIMYLQFVSSRGNEYFCEIDEDWNGRPPRSLHGEGHPVKVEMHFRWAGNRVHRGWNVVVGMILIGAFIRLLNVYVHLDLDPLELASLGPHAPRGLKRQLNQRNRSREQDD
jgi:RsiW-degrading membrane proteinase PrsW (M82 family)